MVFFSYAGGRQIKGRERLPTAVIDNPKTEDGSPSHKLGAIGGMEI